tara:strand:+ start:157 stop:336 length:180 start_codon:yes stop_codon:yes gene_type:complete
MDTNKDGKVTLADFTEQVVKYAAEHNVELPAGWEKEFKKIFNSMDLDSDGSITVKDFKL